MFGIEKLSHQPISHQAVDVINSQWITAWLSIYRPDSVNPELARAVLLQHVMDGTSLHQKLPTEVTAVQAGWLAGQRQRMQCRKQVRLWRHARPIYQACLWMVSSHSRLTSRPSKDQNQDQGYIRLACLRYHSSLIQQLFQAWSPPPPS